MERGSGEGVQLGCTSPRVRGVIKGEISPGEYIIVHLVD
jgi:hypothetical protein